MDREHPAAELSRDELRQPERRSVRRRLVQSTLFPHKENGDPKGERDSDRADNGEDEECCGSQSNKRRKAKGKPTTPKRASKKVIFFFLIYLEINVIVSSAVLRI